MKSDDYFKFCVFGKVRVIEASSVVVAVQYLIAQIFWEANSGSWVEKSAKLLGGFYPYEC